MPKKIYRSKTDRKIAGVCGGLAEYFNIDSTWIRIITILLVLVDGIGILLYLIAWIIIPENPHQKSPKPKAKKEKKMSNSTLGLLVILLALAILVMDVFDWINLKHFTIIALMIAGLYLLMKK